MRRVERGEIPRVVLIHGTDSQLLDDALALVTRALFRDPDEATLGRETFDGAEALVDDVVRSALTLPLATSRRLVVVRRCQALGQKGSDSLAAYVRDPNPSTCLLLLADEALAAGRERRADHWLLGAVGTDAALALPAREGRSPEAWLKQRAAAEGLAVTDEAARLLVDLVGEESAAMLGEARKAALAGGPANRSVGVREVAAVVGEQRLSGVFDLTRAVERRDVGLALRTLDRLLATEEPVRLLALLANGARTALLVADLRARGRSVEEISRQLRRPPGVIEAIARGAVGTPRPALARQLARCWRTEHRLKASAEPRAELAALVAELCSTP